MGIGFEEGASVWIGLGYTDGAPDDLREAIDSHQTLVTETDDLQIPF
tara:strand:- start:267 stop:407 length:141 start_codon:yes stop_codon:yes gene_type:complete